MMALFKKDRCGVCYTELGNRNCPRLRKDIGFRCCNKYRSDGKCPSDCNFALKDATDSGFPTFKADSRTEYTDLLKLYTDYWINRKNPAFEGHSPAEMAKSDPDRIFEWLSSYKYPAGFPLKYLLDRLGLKHSVSESTVMDAEQVAMDYLERVINYDWDALISYSTNTNPPTDTVERYRDLISEIPTLKKLKSFDIVSGGISEDGSVAFVALDLNHKTPWTIILRPHDNSWRVRQHISGTPKDFFGQNHFFGKIAEALANGDEANAWHLIEDAAMLYPDSADLYYYRALHALLIKQSQKAKVQFFNAIALDNSFVAPQMHLAAIYMQEANTEEALKWYLHLYDLQPDDPNIQNNLATCYAAGKDYSTARALWQKLLLKHPDFELARTNLEKLHGLL